MPETAKGSTWDRHEQTAIINKAAALEAGFIEDKHLPIWLLSVETQTKTKRPKIWTIGPKKTPAAAQFPCDGTRAVSDARSGNFRICEGGD